MSQMLDMPENWTSVQFPYFLKIFYIYIVYKYKFLFNNHQSSYEIILASIFTIFELKPDFKNSGIHRMDAHVTLFAKEGVSAPIRTITRPYQWINL